MAEKKKRARKKRATWVGAKNPADESGIVRPTAELDPEQKEEANRMSPAADYKPNPVPLTYLPKKGLKEGEAEAVDKVRTYKAPVQKRKRKRAATRVALEEANIREPKRGELKRGVTAVKVKPKRPKKRNVPTVQRNPQTGKAEPRVLRPVSLPVAGPAEMAQPTPGPRVPLEVPKGGVKEKLWKDEKGVSRRLKGFSVPAEQVSKKAWEAMGHLDSMRMHQSGSSEHSKHVVGFSNAHEETRSMSPEVHQILSFAFKVANAPKYAEQDKHINMAKDALSERISIGRAMEQRRSEAAQAGNEKKDGAK